MPASDMMFALMPIACMGRNGLELIAQEPILGSVAQATTASGR